MRVPGGSVLRLFALIAHALLGALIAALSPGHTLTDTKTGQRIIRLWHRVLLAILGLRLRIQGTPADPPALIVANHISWVDIPALGAVCFGHFVAKSEISAWPIIGWLARQAGTFYIIRGDRKASAGVAERMSAAFGGRQSVILFPEGTSTDGQGVRAFHARLFAAAIETGCLVQPVSVNYPDHKGSIHGAAPFIGEDTLLQHIWRLLRARGEFIVDVQFLPPEPPVGLTARALAERSRAAIVAHRKRLTETPGNPAL